MYDNLLDYLLNVRSLYSWERSPGISNDELDEYIKQIKNDEPIWELTGKYKGIGITGLPLTYLLGELYVSAANLDEALHKAKMCNVNYSDGKIYME